MLDHDAWAAVGIEPIGDWRLALRQALPALTAAEFSEVTYGCGGSSFRTRMRERGLAG